MEDFTVKRLDGPNGKHGWYMYIGFTEMPGEINGNVDCSGVALVVPDGKTEYWFNYSFYHSWDWNVVKDMIIRPAKKYDLSRENLCEVGSDIVHHILEFICMRN